MPALCHPAQTYQSSARPILAGLTFSQKVAANPSYHRFSDFGRFTTGLRYVKTDSSNFSHSRANVVATSEVTLFTPEVEAFRSLINAELDSYTRLDSDCPDHLKEAIRYCVLAPGKRLRPLLVIAANQICNGDVSNAMPSACAVEMIHNYSLIHDDLPAMDDDDLRRGRPTCHVKFGEATAILAGDALIPLAFETIIANTTPASAAAKCVHELAIAAGPSQLVGGQADDLRLQFASPDLAALEKIHRRKTGALLAVSLKLGGISAGATAEQLDSLDQYGKHLGLAFQIVDDLLDLRGSPDKMGKQTGKDAELGKQTYPSVIGEQASENRAQEMADEAVAAIDGFGDIAEPLRALAKFVINRTH
jgi:geranylgeranyl diphosphate synthase type II